jgi:cyclopropane-fatty-acyl-phospholipid synthase
MGISTGTRLEALSPDRSVVRWIMKSAGNPRISVKLWNGDEFRITDSPPIACMEIRDRRAVVELIRSPSIGFGECYSEGRIEIHGDFLAFMNELTRAVTAHRKSNYYLSRIRSVLHATRRNTLRNSHHNVHVHYDLGNDFFKLWLDPRMVYTCAYYTSPSVSLEEAQVAKLDHVCRKLQLRPGQRVVEAGCGWGALALHMAEHYDVEVIAYNNSREQVAYAREQAASRSLGNRVNFVQDDYRKIKERCDVFVSIGMLEHVGMANFSLLGTLIRNVLKPDGIGLVHSIGRSYPYPPDPWITRHIFPGGHMPSLGEIMHVFEPHRFSVLDVENLRPHYARTCADWLGNFEAVAETVTETYDEEFVRKWRLYLAGASAGFDSGTLQLFQVLFTPTENRDVPWTREYQYQGKG